MDLAAPAPAYGGDPVVPVAVFEQGDQKQAPVVPPKVTIKQLPEIPLTSTREQRRALDDLADFYSLLVVCEHLETAFIRGSVSDKEYTAQCKKLLAQYKTLLEQESVPSLEVFVRTYNVDCKAAINRFKIRIPATQLHGGMHDNEAKNDSNQLTVFHCVQHFITTMDSLKLDMRAVDELFPSISDLCDSLNKLKTLPQEHKSRQKVQAWLLILSKMKATEELSDEQARQMVFDLEQAYNSFHKFIEATNLSK